MRCLECGTEIPRNRGYILTSTGTGVEVRHRESNCPQDSDSD